MRKYHLPLFFITIFLIIPSFQACVKEEDAEYYDYALATVLKNDDSNYYLQLDNKKKLLPNDSGIINYYKVEEGQRIYAYFTFLDENNPGYDHTVKMHDLMKILTKPVIDLRPGINDSIGNDPAEIVSMNVGDKYLNIIFQMMGSNDSNRPHMVNLLNATSLENMNFEEGYAYVEFRHNMEGDAPLRMYRGIVSFDLKDLSPEASNLKGLRVGVNTFYNGLQIRKVDFNHEYPMEETLKGISTDIKAELK